MMLESLSLKKALKSANFKCSQQMCNRRINMASANDNNQK